MADFGSARKWARALIEANVGAGARIVDGTVGNGYDTEWLAGLAGRDGRVNGIDIHPEAVERTRTRLEAAGLSERVTLICDGHQRLADYVKEPLDAAVFNLGWLPGSPHACTTQVETTLQAANAALALLKSGGVLTICVYPGHEEGAREREALLQWAGALDDGVYDAVAQEYLNIRKKPPLLIAVTKRQGRFC